MTQFNWKATALGCTLLGATALYPAVAQTAAPASPPAAPEQGGQTTPPPSSNPKTSPDAASHGSSSDGVVIVVTPEAKSSAKIDTADQTAAGKASDREAFFEAHLAALHAGLALTPDQEKLWPALEQSIRMFSTAKSDQGAGRKAVLDPESEEDTEAGSRNSDKADDGLDPFEAVKAAGTLLLERGKALQSLGDAAEPLYKTLTPEQKRRLPVLVRSFAPNNMRLRRFLMLMTWDAQAEKLERKEHPSESERSGSRAGPRNWSDDDGAEARSSMRHGWRHWKDRDRASDDGDDSESGSMPDDPAGDRNGGSAYGRMGQHRYGYGADDSDN